MIRSTGLIFPLLDDLMITIRTTSVNIALTAMLLVAVFPAKTIGETLNESISSPVWESGWPRMIGERIGCVWRPVPNASGYAVYLDGTVVALEQAVSVPGRYPIETGIISVPPGPGDHQVEIAAIVGGDEGPRSAVATIIIPAPPRSFQAPVLTLKEEPIKATFEWETFPEIASSVLSMARNSEGPFVPITSVQGLIGKFTVKIDMYDGNPPPFDADCGTPFIKVRPSWWRVNLWNKNGKESVPSNVVKLDYAWSHIPQ